MSSENKPNPEYLQYGGQAVIEGVMMRSPRFFAVACRKPNGEIIVQEEPVDKSIVRKFFWMNRPLLRGTLALIDAMALGTKALNFAAKVQTDAMAEDTRKKTEGTKLEAVSADASTQSPPSSSRINDMAVGLTMVVSICFGIVLFVALPTLLTQWAQNLTGIPHGTAAAPTPRAQQIQLNLLDGVIRITIFMSYIALISRMENIRRVFQYHGAEHKAINTLEAGLPLTPEYCLQASRIHPRCGTSFIIIVLMASIIVHSLLPRPDFYMTRLALHIGLIPIVAGIAYEIIKLAGKYRDSFLTRTLLAPGLWSQRLTTREPDREHVEVALASLQAVLNREREMDTPKAASPVVDTTSETKEATAAIA